MENSRRNKEKHSTGNILGTEAIVTHILTVRCLLEPGPDLVVCDEGHLLKNEKSAINKAVNRISSLRRSVSIISRWLRHNHYVLLVICLLNFRIVLTGTPLQNNLKEYFEMVNFVKPNLLGSRKEFMNRFVNPILNGQHSDSTERDVRTMKKRSFILNDMLKVSCFVTASYRNDHLIVCVAGLYAEAGLQRVGPLPAA